MDEPIIVVSAFRKRREKLEFQLEERGHAVAHWIDAPKAEEVCVTHPEYRPCTRWFDPYEQRPMTFGELACYAAHRDAWRKIVQLGEPCIVLEDDAVLHGALDEYVFKGEVCYLGGRFLRKASITDADGYNSADFVYHAVAIRYTPRAAKALLDATEERPALPVDEVLPWHCGYHGNPRIDPAKHGVAERLCLEAWAVPEWLVTQSGDFRGTERGGCALDLNTFVLSSDPERSEATLAAWKSWKFVPRLYPEAGERWDTRKEGGAAKLRWMRNALADIPDDEWVLFVDGFDTLPARGPDEVLRRAAELDADVIVGGESHCWPPDDAMEKRLRERHAKGPQPDAPHPFPNSGVILGLAGRIRALLASTGEYGGDDQKWWAQRLLEVGHDTIRVDAESYVSMQLHGTRAGRRNGDPFDFDANCYPAIVHGNNQTNLDIACPVMATCCPEKGILADGVGEWIEVAPGILAMPWLRESACRKILAAANRVPSLWMPLEGDPVPGDELRINALDTTLCEQLVVSFEKHLKPLLEARWRPAAWSSVSDLFLIRYSQDKQSEIGLHCDRSRFSASVALRIADAGGALTFPRQNYRDTDIGLGWLLAWPSAVTHPHMVQEVTRGQRTSLVVWTEP